MSFVSVSTSFSFPSSAARTIARVYFKFHTFSYAVFAASPACIDKEYLCIMFIDFLPKHFCINSCMQVVGTVNRSKWRMLLLVM